MPVVLNIHTAIHPTDDAGFWNHHPHPPTHSRTHTHTHTHTHPHSHTHTHIHTHTDHAERCGRGGQAPPLPPVDQYHAAVSDTTDKRHERADACMHACTNTCTQSIGSIQPTHTTRENFPFKHRIHPTHPHHKNPPPPPQNTHNPPANQPTTQSIANPPK